MLESFRLSWHHRNQDRLRVEMYKGLRESVIQGDVDPTTRGQNIILPSTFTGGARYMIQTYQDAMAICKYYGYPDIFVTFTCNPAWPEIVRFCSARGQRPEDRPDILCRIFKVKLQQMIKDLKEKKTFGRVVVVIYTIEFQKRGLPHAHILLFLHKDDKYNSGEAIDKVISAEIPDKRLDPNYYAAVNKFMIHGPCGLANPNCPCMDNGKCTKHFPKRFIESTTIDNDGYPIYKRSENQRYILKDGVELDNRYVVPHNRELLVKYGAHVNVEWCNQSRSIKYLFKYVNKGNDRITAAFYESRQGEGLNNPVDEIKMYYDCRYVSAPEAAWRTMAFSIQYKDPSVERLNFHLEGQQGIVYRENVSLRQTVENATERKTKFLGWMEANKKYLEANELTYAEFPTKFVWNQRIREWTPRKRGFKIGRVYFVPPGLGEPYYLRILLNIVRGPTSYDEIKTYDGKVEDSFRNACFACGLLDDDKEYIDVIREASHWGTATYLRQLFATILMAKTMERSEYVWDNCCQYLSDDVLFMERRRTYNPDLDLPENEIKNIALLEIDDILRKCGKSLHDFPPMPIPNDNRIYSSDNRLLLGQLNYDKIDLLNTHENFITHMTDEQKSVYETILRKTTSDTGGMFFLYGYGGTGKTFVWNGLASALRLKNEIVLTVASSGIASLLLPGGKTAHSTFSIPLVVTEDSTCSIKLGTDKAELLSMTKLIIWDEAPMVHIYCFEALDKSLRDIMRATNPEMEKLPFGGKTIVFGGDFRQILPVIPKGSRQEIVNATINSSYLWPDCTVLRLTKNMRLRSMDSSGHSSSLNDFAKWILSIGDGTIGIDDDGKAAVDIPEDLLITDSIDPIGSIVDATYPSFSTNLNDPEYLQQRVILAPTLDVVQEVNDYMVHLNDNEEQVYYSSDSICKSDTPNLYSELHTPEVLNSIKCSGMPLHELKLKVGVPVILLRNIDHSSGLCNGTRLIITKLGKRVLEAKIMQGSSQGNKIFIPRMTLTPSDVRLPFKFQRRQFPIAVSFAMTINKSQGQSLNHVGLYLKKPPFSHGQLYVAVSRVTNRVGLKILISDECGNIKKTTTNVVFKEVFP